MNAQIKPVEPRVGVFLDEPPETYYVRRLDEASNSGLKLIDERSPAHYLHWVKHPEDDKTSEELDFGKLFHAVLLEPETVDARFGFQPKDAPKDYRYLRGKAKSENTLDSIAWWDAWEAENAGKTFVSADDMEKAQRMVESLRAHRLRIPVGGKEIVILGGELVDMCRKEVTYRWVDPRTGILCKSRADLECEELRFGGDAKSAVDASPEGFARAVVRRRYHQQHTHYCDGAKECGTPWDNFLFLAVEKTKPYVPVVYVVPAMAEERGRVLRDRAMDTLARCLQADHWPGYSETITELNLPAWAYYDERD